MAQLDDLIRGRIAAYGNIRGAGAVKSPHTGAQVGHGNIGGARNRGKPGYPQQYNIAPEANTNEDEGFQVQSEPLPEGEDIKIAENKWLRGMAAAGALAAASPTAEPTPPPVGMGDVAVAGGKDVPRTVDDHITEASRETGIQPELLRAIISVESRGARHAISHKGAVGMMQLMPDTALEVGVSDPYDQRQNIIGGARYLQKLAQKYGGNLAKTIGAYNAGPSGISGKRIQKWPAETREYLRRVLHQLPKGFNVVSFKPIKLATGGKREPIGPIYAMKEGGGAGVSHFNTDLSGRQEPIPDLEDAQRQNDLPEGQGELQGLPFLIGGTIRRRLREARATRVAVTGGRFEPFHKGHAAVIRQLAGSSPKVVVFVDRSDVFSPDVTAGVIQASLGDIWDKIEMYPMRGDLQSSAQWLTGRPGSTLNPESDVQFSPMPDDEGQFSQRVREALQDDDKDMVRRMLDPRVSTEPASFEKIYAQLRRELGRSGQKPVDVVTDAPPPGSQELNEMGMGAMETGVGWSRGGAFGHSAWSGYNPRGNFEDDEDDEIPNAPKKAAPGAGSEQYQNMTRSPTTRMTDQTYKGVPNDHMPGEFGQRIDDEEDETLKDPTDLSELIARKIAYLKRYK